MVRANDKKLIIEMATPSAADDLRGIQKEIITAIQHYNYKDFGNTDDCPFFHLLYLLEAILPSFHQTGLYLRATEHAKDPQSDPAEFGIWLRRQMEWIKNDNE